MRSYRICRRLLLRCCAAAAISPPTVRVEADEKGQRVRDLLDSRVSPEDPGAFVAVQQGRHVLLECGFGKADVARHLPFTRRTAFDLASCSKQFTAAAVLQLWDRGRLDPEEPARRHLPELPEHDPKRPLTVADLLHMTSGLPDYTTGMGNLAAITNAQVLSWTAKQPLRAATGSRFIYNDTEYALLALLVERASGRSFREYLRREIFEPLGMSRSDVLERPGQSIPGRAEGYTVRDGHAAPARYDTCVYGDGQVMSSADDLLRWDRVLRGGHLLRPETLRYAYRSGKLNSGAETGYACGWHVADAGRVVEHAGGWAGTSVFIRRDLTSGLTVVVLSNQDKLGAAGLGAAIAGMYR